MNAKCAHNPSMNLDSSAFVTRPALLRKLLERALPLDCTKGRVLFRQGDKPYGLFILRGGEASMTLESESGDVLIRTQLAPGSLLGLPALMSGNPYTMSAVAKRRAEVNYVTRKDLSALTLAEPKLALEALRILAAEVLIARAAIVQHPLPFAHDSEALPEDPRPELATQQ
jgi:CRP-like cAMP-binding protein